MTINLSEFQNKFARVYGDKQGVLEFHTKEFYELMGLYTSVFPEGKLHLFSTPGRTEICGNHTDHNLGEVVAASISLDSKAIASKTNTNEICIYSQGYKDVFNVNISDLIVNEQEFGSTNSLIRGIVAKFEDLGYRTGGFNAYIRSDVQQGSGLSSSASIEVLIASILNSFYNDNSISAIELAKIGQYAENVYFGKPCGLMDQVACASGGIVHIDFKDLDNPLIEKMNFEFENYSMMVVETGEDHSNLTADYASIPKDMKGVAAMFDKEVLRSVDKKQILNAMPAIREAFGDRALQRAIHFYDENDRVRAFVSAVKDKNTPESLKIIQSSGNSSRHWLQNIIPEHANRHQGMNLLLNMTDSFTAEYGGASRVHGGGFAGTILVLIPTEYLNNYLELIKKTGRSHTITQLSIRQMGSVHFNSLK